MGRRIAFVIGWVAATFATGLVAWGAVRLAGTQVSTQAVRPLTAAEVQALPEPTTSPPTDPASPPGPTVATTAPPTLPPTFPPLDPTEVTRTTPPPPASTTPPATPPATSPPPTAPPPASSSTTSTTVPAAEPEVKTYHSAGGSVTIVVGNGTVNLGGATPASGYTADVKKAGPQVVEVEFESVQDGPEFKFKARFEGGRLVVEFEGG